MSSVVAIAAHVLAAVVWTGGMFFAYVVLRPTLGEREPPERLQVWSGVFRRFFPWVWLSVLVLLVSGYWLVFGVFGGFAQAPMQVHLMQVLGLLMMALFVYLYYVPYSEFKQAIDQQKWPVAAAVMNRMRQVILLNLVLALVVVAVAAGGRYW